jgi:hypothetical protein
MELQRAAIMCSPILLCSKTMGIDLAKRFIILDQRRRSAEFFGSTAQRDDGDRELHGLHTASILPAAMAPDFNKY